MAQKLWGNRISGKYLIYDGSGELDGDTHVVNYRNISESIPLT